MILLLFYAPLAGADEGVGQEDTSQTDPFTEETQRLSDTLQADAWAVGTPFYRLFGETTPTQLIKMLSAGEAELRFDSAAQVAWNLFTEGLTQALKRLSTVAVLSLLSGFLLNVLKDGERDRATAAASILICCLVMAPVSLLVAGAAKNTAAVTEDLKTLLEAALPSLMALLALGGGSASVSAVQAASALFSNAVLSLYRTVYIPMTVLSFAVAAIDQLIDELSLDKMGVLMRDAGKWFLGLSVTVYAGVIGLQSAWGTQYDSVTLQTARYALRQVVPIVGSVFSDSISIALGSAASVRQAAGITVLLIMLAVILPTAVDILASAAGLRIIAAVTQPVADARIITVADSAGTCMIMLVLGLFSCGLMFVITVGCFMRAGMVLGG